MEKWECKVCGYIYDPEQGDPDGNIPPKTPFEKLPDEWVCPVCGAPKDMFEKAQDFIPALALMFHESDVLFHPFLISPLGDCVAIHFLSP